MQCVTLKHFQGHLYLKASLIDVYMNFCSNTIHLRFNRDCISIHYIKTFQEIVAIATKFDAVLLLKDKFTQLNFYIHLQFKDETCWITGICTSNKGALMKFSTLKSSKNMQKRVFTCPKQSFLIPCFGPIFYLEYERHLG